MTKLTFSNVEPPPLNTN